MINDLWCNWDVVDLYNGANIVDLNFDHNSQFLPTYYSTFHGWVLAFPFIVVSTTRVVDFYYDPVKLFGSISIIWINLSM